MGKKKNDAFWESGWLNNRAYQMYYNRLLELATSVFEWKNLPTPDGSKPGVDSRFMELALFSNGLCLFFEDEVLGYLGLQCTLGGGLDVYLNPIERNAYASNGYFNVLNNKNSVIIYNNYLKTPSLPAIEYFARRLWQLDRIVDINVNAQKSPYIITCDENQLLTAKNMYKQLDGNEPVIFGKKGIGNIDFNVLNTNAPYVADKIQKLKNEIWNEALTFLGISNISIAKKERMITDEVMRSQGGTVASRNSRLKMRQKACDEINTMFGLHVSVEYSQFIDVNLPESENINE